MGFRDFWKQWIGNQTDRTTALKNEMHNAADQIGENVEQVTQNVVKVTDKVWEEIEQKSNTTLHELKESEIGQSFIETTKKVGDEIREGILNTGNVLHEAAEKIRQKMDEPLEDPFENYKKSHEEVSHLDALKQTPSMDQGSFLDKASRFADGDYSSLNKDTEPVTASADNAPIKDNTANWTGNIHGFIDRDGDQDPLIDDAEIEEEQGELD